MSAKYPLLMNEIKTVFTIYAKKTLIKPNLTGKIIINNYYFQTHYSSLEECEIILVLHKSDYINCTLYIFFFLLKSTC